MMGALENPIEKGKIRSLPLDLWPEADRSAWISACRPAARLKRGGTAGHLKPITRDDLARRYGYFLDFLGRHGLFRVDTLAATYVTPENVETYIAELKQRVSSVTLYGSIYKLRRAAEIIAPSLDFAWLAELEKDLALVMQPRSKFDRIVLIEVLVEAGLTLIYETEFSPNLTRLARARQVRNGLMVALLGLCPIRLKNFAALEIGRSFVEIKGRWWIVLSASETKEGRSDERPVPELLTPVIDRYLEQHRPVLARSHNPASALWLSHGYKRQGGGTRDQKRHAFNRGRKIGPAYVSDLRRICSRRVRRRESLSWQCGFASRGSARHDSALQPCDKFVRGRKFPTDRSAVHIWR